jgi:agmatine deiminase
MPTPQKQGFLQPAEWTPHSACWVAWPSDKSLWLANLEPARAAWIKMARAIASGETLEVLVPDAGNEVLARKALSGVDAHFHRVPFGDIWLRDTAPIFVRKASGEVASARFGFNGWGGKYVLEHDSEVASRIAVLAGMREFATPWILEGGSIDVDGEGTCLTTRQCLLNPNRNPRLSQSGIEEGLQEQLGIAKTIWLGDGLLNDHTDGHVDNVARFVASGQVLCMRSSGSDDPNREALENIAGELAGARDAKGRKLTVVRIPSPGLVTGKDTEEGRPLPASYVNFYIGNRAVVVPAFATRFDDEAARAIGELFPGRSIVPVDANAILTGGGAFHCITQQVPR